MARHYDRHKWGLFGPHQPQIHPTAEGTEANVLSEIDVRRLGIYGQARPVGRKTQKSIARVDIFIRVRPQIVCMYLFMYWKIFSCVISSISRPSSRHLSSKNSIFPASALVRSQRPSYLCKNIGIAGAVGVWPDKYWLKFACCLCVQESDFISIWRRQIFDNVYKRAWGHACMLAESLATVFVCERRRNWK